MKILFKFIKAPLALLGFEHLSQGARRILPLSLRLFPTGALLRSYSLFFHLFLVAGGFGLHQSRRLSHRWLAV